jgi:hypothetical protein
MSIATDRDFEILRLMREVGGWRHAVEWAEAIGVTVGRMTGALGRLAIDRRVHHRTGRRERFRDDGSRRGEWPVQEFAPSLPIELDEFITDPSDPNGTQRR